MSGLIARKFKSCYDMKSKQTNARRGLTGGGPVADQCLSEESRDTSRVRSRDTTPDLHSVQQHTVHCTLTPSRDLYMISKIHILFFLLVRTDAVPWKQQCSSHESMRD